MPNKQIICTSCFFSHTPKRFWNDWKPKRFWKGFTTLHTWAIVRTTANFLPRAKCDVAAALQGSLGRWAAGGLMVSASASVLGGREFSAGSYQDLVNWHCSLLTRLTMCGRSAGNTIRTQKQAKWNESRHCTLGCCKWSLVKDSLRRLSRVFSRDK